MTQRPRNLRGIGGGVVLVCGLVAAVAVRAGGVVQAPRRQPQRLAQMQHHFTQVTLIHEAVIRGDLPAVRAPATELAQVGMPPGMPTSTLRFVSTLRQAGRRAADAKTLTGAAAATASMLNQCGDCHLAAVARPGGGSASPPGVGGIVGHMLEHQAAVDDLLQGLLIPSPAQWALGVDRLRTAPLDSDDLPPDPNLTESLRQAEARIHQVADSAALADTARSRSSVYARILATCAECHGLHQVVWGPRSIP